VTARKEIRGLDLQREKEIREDMKQLAASEARVAALERTLQDKALPSNPQGDAFVRLERAYFSDFAP